MKAICKICYHYELCKTDERCLPEYLNCNFFKNKLDVVEVVRCKDCKFSRQLNEQEQHTFVDGVLMCESYEMNDIPCAVYPEDYCSYGERKCEDGK